MTFQRKRERAVTTKHSARGWLPQKGGAPRKEEGQRSFGNWTVDSDGGYCPKVPLETSRTLCSLQMWNQWRFRKTNERKRNKQRKKKTHQKLIPNYVEFESLSLFRLLIDSQLQPHRRCQHREHLLRRTIRATVTVTVLFYTWARYVLRVTVQFYPLQF